MDGQGAKAIQKSVQTSKNPINSKEQAVVEQLARE